jgi:hypothetical protein
VARTRPQLLVLEDLHWADESTLALLTYLVNRIAQLRAVIIGTYSSGYSDDNPASVRTLEELIRLGDPSAQAGRSIQRRCSADVTWAKSARDLGKSAKRHL